MWTWKDDPDPDLLPVVAVLLFLILTLGIVDLSLDLGLRNPAHLILEVTFLLLCLVFAFFLGSGWLRARGKLDRIRATMAEREAAFFLEDLLLPMEPAPENR